MENRMLGVNAGSGKEQRIDFFALSKSLGKQIVITLSDGTYQGELIHVDYGRAIMMSKVKDLANGERKSGVHPFNASDILHVEIPTDKGKHPAWQARTQTTADSGIGPSFQDPKILKEFKPDSLETKPEGKNAIDISLQIIERAVENLEITFTVIDQLQVMFNLAINHIQCQTELGVSAAGSNLCRHGNLRWIQVASKSRIYMFDITALGPNVFKCGLKAVLEDEKIIKVIHDCRGLSDCLYHQYGVAINNVFDTQVADIFLFHMKTDGVLPARPSTLEECLKKYLNKPPSQISFLMLSQGIMQDINLFWPLYPMPLALQKALAVEASYVLSLHTAMITAMMADFSALVSSYIKVYTQGDENVSNWTQRSNSRIPEDFQMLNNLQAERREMSLNRYAVGDRALPLSPGCQQEFFGEMEKKANAVPTFPHGHPVFAMDIAIASTKKF